MTSMWDALSDRDYLGEGDPPPVCPVCKDADCQCAPAPDAKGICDGCGRNYSTVWIGTKCWNCDGIIQDPEEQNAD